MKSLVNEPVRHIKYGKGNIVNQENNRIEISFDDNVGTKSFLFPDSFERFLTLEQESLQKECYELAIAKRETQEMEERAKQMEQERIRVDKIKEMKVPKRKRISIKSKI
jgi:hypothetical protein